MKARPPRLAGAVYETPFRANSCDVLEFDGPQVPMHQSMSKHNGAVEREDRQGDNKLRGEHHSFGLKTVDKFGSRRAAFT